MTLQAALELAWQQYRTGRLVEAEALSAQILAQHPDEPTALQVHGLAALGRSDFAAATRSFQRAASVQPGNANHLSNLSFALQGHGQMAEAVVAARRALLLRPDFAQAHFNLGNALVALGEKNAAAAAFREALKIQPGMASAHNSLGNLQRAAGEMELAEASYRHALQSAPHFAEAWSNLGTALGDLGRYDEAAAAFEKALSLQPGHPEIQYNFGRLLVRRGQLEAAVAAFETAIRLQPNRADLHTDLGTALDALGRYDAALAAFGQALRCQPNFGLAHFNLGNALRDHGDLGAARECFVTALQIDPTDVPAWINLGTVQRDLGDFDSAIACYRRALVLAPEHAGAWNNLGVAFYENGQLDESIAAYRQAIAHQPDRPDFHSNLLLTLNYHPELDARAIADEHQRWNRQHAEPLRRFMQPHANDRDGDRRLRIGYVSPDFREHSVACFVESLLAEHRRAEVDVVCYSAVSRPDVVTTRLMRLAGAWRDINRLSDAQVGDLVREDRIDILVDLAGHTAGNRLPLFARKPAPVQVTWLGYPNTTGLSSIDYRVTDAIADPPGDADLFYTEQLVRLPGPFACFRASEDSPPAGPLPALARGYVTFGSFHILAKLNERHLETWAKILTGVPGSRLMMVAKGLHERTCRQRFTEFFANRGISSERLEFRARQTATRYLALHHELDVLLDSHPFSGHTVSCHALWMGVPVVTLTGTTHRSRMVTSVLTNVGLNTLVADGAGRYVSLAIELASDLPRLAELRRTLRPRMEKSVLMDAPRFARQIEDAYRTMWRRWCARASETESKGVVG